MVVAVRYKELTLFLCLYTTYLYNKSVPNRNVGHALFLFLYYYKVVRQEVIQGKRNAEITLLGNIYSPSVGTGAIVVIWLRKRLLGVTEALE